MKKPAKVRLDVLLVERGLALTRVKAQALIMAGSVTVGGLLADKSGRAISVESVIDVKKPLLFVGRGGIKLDGFIATAGIDVTGLIVMDVGSSTGGFTDCLLKRGVRRVYAVDVGKGIIDASLRNDLRVKLLEERNIRHLAYGEVGEKVDLAVIDVSFISLEKVLLPVKGFLKSNGMVLALVKPQFEVGKGEVGKGGIVKDTQKHIDVVERVTNFAVSLGFELVSSAQSQITGAKGNKEFWLQLRLKDDVGVVS